jgi:hypothetical protein
MNRAILRGLTLITTLVIFFLVYKEYGLGGGGLHVPGYSVRVSEVKIDDILVQRPLAVHEFSEGIYIDEGEGYETVTPLSGHKFVLLHLEIKNIKDQPLHLLGRDSKVIIGSDGKTYLPGLVSRKTRNSTMAEVAGHYYEQLVSLQTLAPGEKIEGWAVFEIPVSVDPVEFRWYSDFTKNNPSFTMVLR